MSVDRRMAEINEALAEARAIQAEARKSGNGGGTSDGMEQRVSRLEGQFDDIRKDNALLRDRIAETSKEVGELKRDVAHLPSKGYIDARLFGLLLLIAALITFGEKLRALAG